MNTDDLIDETLRLQEELEATELLTDNIRAERDQSIVTLRKAGMSAIRIGELIGLTRQRVHRILGDEPQRRIED